MTTRSAEVGLTDRLGVEPRALVALVAAALGLGLALPLVFDLLPDGAVVQIAWGAVLLGAGWWLCGLAPAATRTTCRRIFLVAFLARAVLAVTLVAVGFWQDDELLYP